MLLLIEALSGILASDSVTLGIYKTFADSKSLVARISLEAVTDIYKPEKALVAVQFLLSKF